MYLSKNHVHAILVNVNRIDRQQPRSLEVVVCKNFCICGTGLMEIGRHCASMIESLSRCRVSQARHWTKSETASAVPAQSL